MPSPSGQPTALPFDDIRSLFRLMPSPDEAARSAVALRNGELTKPAGSLGRIEDLAQWLAAWQGQASPAVNRPLVAIFASAHGVAAQSVSAYPSAVNTQMLDNFTKGGAAINQICMTNDIGLKVFDLAIDMPTPDITENDAFDEAGCAATIAFGMEAIAGADLLCLGEMGIGNTTVASAIVYALYGGKAEDWVGAGTGVTGETLARKVDAVERAVARLKGERDPLEILRRIGGREIAALVGAIIAGRLQKVPILLDGFVVSAAAALVHAWMRLHWIIVRRHMSRQRPHTARSSQRSARRLCLILVCGSARALARRWPCRSCAQRPLFTMAWRPLTARVSPAPSNPVSLDLFALSQVKRQGEQSAARCRMDRIGDGRAENRQARLTNARRRGIGRDDMHLNLGHF